MAILKGVPKHRIIFRHAFASTLGPIINVVALNIGFFDQRRGGCGIGFLPIRDWGRLIIDAVSFRDIPLVQATALCFCFFLHLY